MLSCMRGIRRKGFCSLMIMSLSIGMYAGSGLSLNTSPFRELWADYCIYLKQVSFIYLIILIATVALFKIPRPFSTQMGYAKWTFALSCKAEWNTHPSGSQGRFLGGEIAYHCKIVSLMSKDLLLPDWGHLNRAQSQWPENNRQIQKQNFMEAVKICTKGRLSRFSTSYKITHCTIHIALSTEKPSCFPILAVCLNSKVT